MSRRTQRKNSFWTSVFFQRSAPLHHYTEIDPSPNLGTSLVIWLWWDLPHVATSWSAVEQALETKQPTTRSRHLRYRVNRGRLRLEHNYHGRGAPQFDGSPYQSGRYNGCLHHVLPCILVIFRDLICIRERTEFPLAPVISGLHRLAQQQESPDTLDIGIPHWQCKHNRTSTPHITHQSRSQSAAKMPTEAMRSKHCTPSLGLLGSLRQAWALLKMAVQCWKQISATLFTSGQNPITSNNSNIAQML